jgi:hypothetical protein
MGQENTGSAGPKHFEARNGVAERGSKKNIRREMCGGRDSREADRSGESINGPWDPAVSAIAVCDNRGYSKGACGMTGREAAAFERGLSAAKKCIVERLTGRDIGGALPARYCFYCQIYDRSVGVSLSGQQTRLNCVRIVPQVAADQDRNRHQSNLSASNRGVEGVVQIVKVSRMPSKIGHYMRVRDD